MPTQIFYDNNLSMGRVDINNVSLFTKAQEKIVTFLKNFHETYKYEEISLFMNDDFIMFSEVDPLIKKLKESKLTIRKKIGHILNDVNQLTVENFGIDTHFKLFLFTDKERCDEMQNIMLYNFPFPLFCECVIIDDSNITTKSMIIEHNKFKINPKFDKLTFIIQCGTISEKVNLFPMFPYQYLQYNNLHNKFSNIKSIIFDIYGFFPYVESLNFPSLSKHVILSTETVSNAKGKSNPNFLVLLHASLKLEGMCALVKIQILESDQHKTTDQNSNVERPENFTRNNPSYDSCSEEWYGLVYTTFTSGEQHKKKSNLFISILPIGTEFISTIGDLNFLTVHGSDKFLFTNEESLNTPDLVNQLPLKHQTTVKEEYIDKLSTHPQENTKSAIISPSKRRKISPQNLNPNLTYKPNASILLTSIMKETTRLANTTPPDNEKFSTTILQTINTQKLFYDSFSYSNPPSEINNSNNILLNSLTNKMNSNSFTVNQPYILPNLSTFNCTNLTGLTPMQPLSDINRIIKLVKKLIQSFEHLLSQLAAAQQPINQKTLQITLQTKIDGYYKELNKFRTRCLVLSASVEPLESLCRELWKEIPSIYKIIPDSILVERNEYTMEHCKNLQYILTNTWTLYAEIQYSIVTLLDIDENSYETLIQPSYRA